MLRCSRCNQVVTGFGIAVCLCVEFADFAMSEAPSNHRHVAVLTTNGRDDMAHTHDEKVPPPVARLANAALSTAAASAALSEWWQAPARIARHPSSEWWNS